MTFIFVIIACAVVFSATLYFATKMTDSKLKKMTESIHILAEKMNLKVIEHRDKKLSAFYATELNGEIDNRKFHFRSFTRSVQTSESFSSEFSWFCDLKEQHHLQITRESVVATLQKQFGVEDIQLNDKKFDDQFLIKCDNAEYARTILNSTICAELLKRERIIYGTIYVRNKEIHYEESGVLGGENDADRMYRIIQLCRFIAVEIEKNA